MWATLGETHMLVSTNDPIWANMYPRIRDEFIADPRTGWDRREMERYLSRLNITVVKDPADGRWQQIELPEGRELTLLMLKYC